MPNFRRAFIEGGTFFFTLVTAERRGWLCDESARVLLRECLRRAQARRPFTLDAIVLLPDHLHAIWTLPVGDSDFATRWADIKANFTRSWLRSGGEEGLVTEDQRRQERRGVWQPRYMEHCIRDEDDYIAHTEYLWFNPVKHGLVTAPSEWPWSTFHRLVREGIYHSDWGRQVAPIIGGVREDLVELGTKGWPSAG